MSLGLGRSLAEGNSSPLQYFCLKNSMDRRAWRAIGGRKSRIKTNAVTFIVIHNVSGVE